MASHEEAETIGWGRNEEQKVAGKFRAHQDTHALLDHTVTCEKYLDTHKTYMPAHKDMHTQVLSPIVQTTVCHYIVNTHNIPCQKDNDKEQGDY